MQRLNTPLLYFFVDASDEFQPSQSIGRAWTDRGSARSCAQKLFVFEVQVSSPDRKLSREAT